MPPVVIDLHHADDPRDAVHRAVQALAEGQLVVVPTETVYGLAASALDEEAIARLLDVKGRREGNPLTLAVKSADDALDYVPDLSPLGRRFARRCWPGPVTLVLDDAHPDSVLTQLPESVRQAVSPNGTIGLRVPAHRLVLDVLRLSAGPLALTSANRSGTPDQYTAQGVIEDLGDEISLVLDDGHSKYAKPSSVVRVGQESYEILRSGVYSDSQIHRLSSLMVLLVCTGNTCRSPMAEALMRGQVAKRLDCNIDELEDNGVVIVSAGIAALAGGRASRAAAQVMNERSLALSDHVSQPLTDQLVRYADLILTMTRGHREAIIAQWPDAASRTSLLCADERDVADPIGGSIDQYRRCAEQIEEQLTTWVDGLDLTKKQKD